MPRFSIRNIKINAIAATVPGNIERVIDLKQFDNNDLQKLIDSTGISERRVADETICTSDLCFKSAETLLTELNWDRSTVDALIFVTQTPDYYLPATSPLLQHKLGLNQNCFTLDISEGCAGYVHGLYVLSKLIDGNHIKRGLLLVGDTSTKLCSRFDKSTYPLFGDGGTATALEYDTAAPEIKGNFFSDGSGYESIIIRDGQSRNPPSESSIELKQISEGIVRRNLDLELDGMSVFSFGITKPPESVRDLLILSGDEIEDIDYFVFHQANKFMNEKIRKKLNIPLEKNLYSLESFGNTSSSTIPLTLVTALPIDTKREKVVICGFGVGLSWGSILLNLEETIILPLIEL